VDSALPAVMVDPDQVTQVIVNLLINAADALELVQGRRPRVEIRTQVEGDRALLVVSDNGQGMDADIRNHAFEAFFTTKPAGKGTGLGLSFCQSIIDAQGGEIRINSQPGTGTQVTVLLPIAEEDMEGAMAS
jgi:signal transduction histidine kinase